MKKYGITRNKRIRASGREKMSRELGNGAMSPIRGIDFDGKALWRFECMSGCMQIVQAQEQDANICALLIHFLDWRCHDEP